YVSALLMAITACSAKGFSSSTWLSENPPMRAAQRDRPDRRTVAHEGDRQLRSIAKGLYVGMRRSICAPLRDLDNAFVQNGAAGERAPRGNHRKQLTVLCECALVARTNIACAVMHEGAVKLNDAAPGSVAQFICLANDQIEDRLWVPRRG